MAKSLDLNYLPDKLKQKIKANLPVAERLTLASVKLKGDDYSSKMYTLQQAKLSQDLGSGVDYRPILLNENASLVEVLTEIEKLNKDRTITGIVFNKPFPKAWPDEEIFSAICPDKDIEGMNPINLGKLFLGKPVFIPPTVASVLEFIDYSKIELYGRRVTIVGASNIIGKPLSLLLADKFASVSITHIGTFEAGDLEAYVKEADLVISAAGVAGLIKADWIKKGAVVIDVGINQRDGKTVGDVEITDSLTKKVSFISPVPGGVGKLTTMFLFHNLLTAYRVQKK